MRFQTICVLGLGYIGLPTASTFANSGLKVTGVDVNERIVTGLRLGELHIEEPGLRTLVQSALASGNLRIAAQPEPADAFLIAVPTPVRFDKRADLSAVVAAAEVDRPTSAPARTWWCSNRPPRRARRSTSSPRSSSARGCAPASISTWPTHPNACLPGQILRELVENARVIGGFDRASAEAGRDLYATFVRGEIVLTDATTAEMVKLMENTYRDVNIAAANEFARLADRFGVDVWEAIALANRHPRVEILRPGPGVGGHCISVDPWFLVESAPELTALIRQARLVNDAQPAFAAGLIERALGGLRGRSIAALGLAYKPDVDDLRESPAIEVARLLAQGGARVTTFEPFAPETVVPGCEAAASLEAALKGADAVVLLADHRAFIDLDPAHAAAAMPGRVAVDTRGRWDRARWTAAGFHLYVLGAGERDG